VGETKIDKNKNFFFFFFSFCSIFWRAFHFLFFLSSFFFFPFLLSGEGDRAEIKEKKLERKGKETEISAGGEKRKKRKKKKNDKKNGISQ